MAKNKESQSKFCSLFEKSNVKKTYLALVTGCPESQTGEIDAPLMQSEKDPRKMLVNSKKGKDAKTRWQLLADFGSVSLVAARPVTGRTHQIRVHFQHAGFPLVIDPKYRLSRDLLFVHTSWRLRTFILSRRLRKNSRLQLKCSQNTIQRAQRRLLIRTISTVCLILNPCRWIFSGRTIFLDYKKSGR
jgi:23S rRNA-/tRNA-specific pseudouridylate synthase